MSREILLDEHNQLRLFREGNSRVASLVHEDVLLLKTELWPGWFCPSPLASVRCLMQTLRPMSPRVIKGKSKTFSGGLYSVVEDTIVLYGTNRMSGEEIADLLLHEVCHCVGHASRLARPHYAGMTGASSQTSSELAIEHSPEFFHQLELEVDGVAQEEFTTILCGTLVAVRVGIDPTATGAGAVGWPAWFKRASGLPLDDLKQGIADARAGAAFILND